MSPAYARRKPNTRPPSPLPEKITAYLAENPGDQLYKIVEALNASRGAVTYQLRNLENAGIIKVHEETGCRRYYLYNFAYAKEEALLNIHLENKTKAGIIHSLQETPGLSRKELAEKTGVPQNTLYRHIAALCKAGILKQERDGHMWRYRLSEKTERLQKERRR